MDVWKIFLSLLLLTSTEASAIVVPYEFGRDLYPGRGYNTFTGESLGDCIEINKEQLGTVAPTEVQLSSDSTKYAKLLTTSTEAANVLDASASARGEWLAGSFSASARFFRQATLSSYQQTLILFVNVANAPVGFTPLTPPRLTKAASRLYRRNRIEFVKRCGDAFIDAVQYGGKFVAFLTIETKDQLDERNVKATLSGSYGQFSGDASVQSKMSDMSKNRAITIHVIRAGGEGTLPANDVEKLLQ